MPAAGARKISTIGVKDMRSKDHLSLEEERELMKDLHVEDPADITLPGGRVTKAQLMKMDPDTGIVRARIYVEADVVDIYPSQVGEVYTRRPRKPILR